MIIRSLQIENFGHFHNYRLDGLGFGVNPIIGENEFGKTTLLEFIRRIFWGFQVRRNSDLNPYPALDGSGLYGGRITLELSTGKRIEVERLGPKNGRLKLTRADGSVTEDETELQKLLDVSRTFYTNVYAITLDELHALTFLNDEEIRTRLYGAGLAQGDLSLPKLGAAFDRQAAALFQARGKKNRIAVLATELTALQQNFSAAEQQLPAFEAARQRAVDAKARIASLRAEGVRTAAELRREEQLAGGAERFQILQRRLEERERLPAFPPDFAAGATTEFARLKAELSRATDRLAIRLERHDILKQQEAELPRENGKLLAAEPDILRLEQQLENLHRNQEEQLRHTELSHLAAGRCSELEKHLAGKIAAPEALREPSRSDFDRIGELERMREQLAAGSGREGRSTSRCRRAIAVLLPGALLLFLALPFISGILRGAFAVTGTLLLCGVLTAAWAGRRKEKMVREKLAGLEAECDRLAASFGLVRGIPSAELPDLLEELGELLRLRREISEHRRVSSDCEIFLKRFAMDYAALPGASGEPEGGLVHLRNELEHQKAAAARRKLLAEQRSALGSELAAAVADRQAAEKALQNFLGQFGVETESAFHELEKRRDAAQELERDLSADREALRLLFEGMIPEQELRAYSPAEGALRRQELAARLQELEEQTAAETAAAGAAEADMQRLLAAGDPAVLANRIEGVRGELRATAREYLILSGAHHLLNRAVTRYERERQPEVIRRATTLFQAFTCGRYSRIHKSLATGELLLTDSLHQCEKRPAELSRGTLEELMTAMRLALIACCEEEHEPLPIVLDDLFVNFDGNRRRAALEALETFAAQRQILLLSCR